MDGQAFLERKPGAVFHFNGCFNFYCNHFQVLEKGLESVCH